MPPAPVALQLLSQLESISQRFKPPRVARLHVPADLKAPSDTPRDAAFCAIELGMIGFFPPLVRQVQAIGARLTVAELDQATVLRQRTRFPGVDVTLDRSRLATCNVVMGTSTMLLNDTLDAMLAAAPGASRFAVIGPSAGLCPDALFARGVTLSGGTRVVDGAGFRAALAGAESWSGSAQKFALSASDWPGWRSLLA